MIRDLFEDRIGTIGVRTFYVEKASPLETGDNEPFNGRVQSRVAQ